MFIVKLGVKQIIITNFWKFKNIFKKKYLKNCKNWNYYNNINHITNNSLESFNNYLNNIYFQKILLFIN